MLMLCFDASLLPHPRVRRGKGIGQTVVKALVNDLRPDEEVWLTTPKNRMPFYERLGFTGDVVDGEVLRRIPRWVLLALGVWA